MAEELNFKITADTSSAVKGAKDFGNAVKDAEGVLKDLIQSEIIQNELINEQQKELLKLKQVQSELDKGGWNAGAASRKKAIEEGTFALQEMKLGLNDVKIAQKGATAEVKDAKNATKEFEETQKETNTSLKDSIMNFKVMGFSLNSIKSAAKKVIPAIKAMFTSIKVGIASTGIGLLLLALGGVIAYFTQTKAGAEGLKKVLTVVGTVVKVLIDRMISYAKMLFSILTLDFQGVADNAKAAFGGLGDELSREIALAIELEDRTNALTDSNRALSVLTAQRKNEIQQLIEKSKDLSKTEEERMNFLEQASAIETNTLAQRLVNAEEALSIQQGLMSMSDNMAADLDKLAELEINLSNIRLESSKTQTRLLRGENALRKKMLAEERKRQAAWQKKQNEISKANIKLKKEASAIFLELALRKLDDDEKREKAVLKRNAKIRLDEIKDSKLKDSDKVKASRAVDELLTSDLKIVTAKHKKIRVDAQKEINEAIVDSNNELRISQINNETDRLIEEADVAEMAEIKAIKSSAANAEEKELLIFNIQQKYNGLRAEINAQDVVNQKAAAEELSAFKTDLLMKGLDLIMSGFKLQDQAATKEFNKDMKRAKKNGKDTSKIEKAHEKAMEKSAKKQKAIKVGLAIVDTYQSAIAAYNSALALPIGGLALAPISAGIAVVAGLANVAAIQGADVSGGGGGGAGAGGGGGGELPTSGTPSPQLMSGAFDITGAVAPEPIKAFVITDEMSSSQDQLANIRRRATI